MMPSGPAGAPDGTSLSQPGLVERIRAICLALPEVTERPSHGAPTWFVRGKTFVTLWADGHHEHGFPHLWCAAPPGAQQELTLSAPEVFFRPPYVGGRGWIGVRLDVPGLDWPEIAGLCADAYRTIAPRRLADSLGTDPGPATGDAEPRA
ncbi:MAG TPA: MmcQ/YjbR family DNA-binding protein [Streptosporangiaceae bacterium]|jgi:hypothetical protein|nr:MmcQ/YjbR family DNA-binding protein [Streptosporangiaceae bacterium]